MLLKISTVIGLTAFGLVTAKLSLNNRNEYLSQTQVSKPQPKKIQAAILLDVSGSMEGLIEQAKVQIWNMVSLLGKGNCDGQKTEFEIALYEYGRPKNGVTNGYIKQITPFTKNLDSLSVLLFALKTDGGDEFCTDVCKTSLNELNWSQNDDYKVIFIAGNESFLQGKTSIDEVCRLAKEKNVYINSIYCGDFNRGLIEHWDKLKSCYDKTTYSHINHNDNIDDIPTPYDTTLITLNTSLNNTYMWYGDLAGKVAGVQIQADRENFALNKKAFNKRVVAKAQSKVYVNKGYDLIDDFIDNEDVLKQIPIAKLNDTLKNKSLEDIKKIVKTKAEERNKIQKSILEINEKRMQYIKENSANKNELNLETVIENNIKQQAQKCRISFKVSE